MQTCGNCGQPRTEGKKFCTKCGMRFSDDERESPRPALGSSRYLAVAVGAACVLALAGIGVGGWFLAGHAGASAGGGPAGTVVTPSANPASRGTDTPTETATPTTPASTGAPTPSGPVTVASAAMGYDQTQSVADFLDQYFDAINAHDYQSYNALLGSNVPAVSQAEFEKGYGTTADSGETLTHIYTASNGDYIAEVRFTSRQSPSDSPDNSACDNWDIYLYLTPDGGGSYLIDRPQSGYHANHSAC